LKDEIILQNETKIIEVFNKFREEQLEDEDNISFSTILTFLKTLTYLFCKSFFILLFYKYLYTLYTLLIYLYNHAIKKI